MIASYFETKSGGKTPEYAQAYLTGLLSQVRRKNMEGFAEAVPDVPWQNLQQFLSDSPWEWGPLWGWLGKEVSRDLGGGADNMLLIDESAFAKKGEKSVGVARQYSGRLGKVDNCQVGVFSCLSRGERAALIGARLYLPEEWTDDPERCTKAGVPEADQGFQTKNQLARELIAEASANGAEFGWVAFDAGYGREQHLLVELDAQGKFFMADVESDQLVWLERPAGEERPARLREAGARPVDGIRRLDPGRPREVVLRQGENGKVKVQVQCRRVWIWPESFPKPLGVWLVISRLAHGKIKFSLSNAPVDTSWEELARRQGQRFFIERCFEDAKSDLGMAEYASV